MKKTLLPLAGAFGLALNLFPLSLQAQTPWDHNEGLLITEGSAGDTVILSWWGRTDHFYEIEVSEDLLEWNTLPEVIEGFGGPIARELNISHNRWFMRVQISHLIASLFSENPNLKLLPGRVEYIGTEHMRGTFSGGYADSLPIDSGWVFSTGEAEKWNAPNYDHDKDMESPGDLDLEHWMRTQGFGPIRPHPTAYGAYETLDASGISFDFVVDPSVAVGEFEMAFFFASEEYEIPPQEEPKNDGMAIFISEIDSNGDEIPGTRANIALLPDTESHSRAINIMNAGFVVNDLTGVNVQESGFTLNTQGQPPNSFGFSGVTGRIEASGGPTKIFGDVSVKTRVRQMKVIGLGNSNYEYGWGGVVLKGHHNLDHEFSGYVVAFGMDSGNVVFTLYRIENHNTFEYGNPLYRNDTFVIPNESHSRFHQESVTVLESVQVGNSEFNQGEWYWIRAEVDGDNIRARFWDGGEENEPEAWAIDVTDNDEPLSDGFVGLVHLDTASYSEWLDGVRYVITESEMQWDLFEVDDGSVSRTDFGADQSEKRIPFGWAGSSFGTREWEIVEDTNSLGGKFIKHDMEGAASDDLLEIVSILKFKGPGKVEGGKRYRVKVVVADTGDYRWDSIVFLEGKSFRVLADGE